MILIVEDEFLVSLAITEELEFHGCEVTSACNADEAIAILESRSDIEVVLTDVNMPGSMDGLRLAAAIRDRWPPIKVIVTSGKIRPSQLPDQVSFLAKPYNVSDVVRTVEQYCAKVRMVAKDLRSGDVSSLSRPIARPLLFVVEGRHQPHVVAKLGAMAVEKPFGASNRACVIVFL